MQQMMMVVYVATGGAIGATLRYFLASFFQRIGPEHFPIGILSVNVIGSMLIGVLVEVLAHFLPENQLMWRTFLATGVMGGFTTFSAFSLEAAAFIERGQYGAGALYIGATVILSIAMFFAGMLSLRWVFAA